MLAWKDLLSGNAASVVGKEVADAYRDCQSSQRSFLDTADSAALGYAKTTTYVTL